MICWKRESHRPRAASTERKQRIAVLLAHSLTEEERSFNDARVLLNLLGELSDAEFIMLGLYGTSLPAKGAYWAQHAAVLGVDAPTFESSAADIDRYTVSSTYRARLVRLGMLRMTYRKPKKDSLPEFDFATGTVKPHSLQITPLGRLLLRTVQVDASEFDGSDTSAEDAAE